MSTKPQDAGGTVTGFVTLRDPETHAKAHRALVMHYLQGGKTSEELMQRALERTLKTQHIDDRFFEAEDIHDIRARYAAGELQKSIADDYGVSQSMMSRILNGKYYRDVPESERAA